MQKLHRLEMLHLYQNRAREVLKTRFLTEEQTSSQVDGFVAEIFQRAHDITNLKVLVWGVHSENSASSETEGIGVVLERWPKLYYVKRVITGESNEEQVVAVRTTLDRIREEFPWLDLLRYDPTYDSMEHCASQI